MGQAKARGTHAQRVAQAQQRDAVMRAERERRDNEAKERAAQRIAAMPPEEQKQYRDRLRRHHMQTANMVGMLLAMSALGSRHNA